MRDDEIVLARGPSFYVGRVFIYGCLLAFAAVYVFPLLVVVLTSLKDLDDIRSGYSFASRTANPAALV
jgi:glucose/mannose transport system permease protein